MKDTNTQQQIPPSETEGKKTYNLALIAWGCGGYGGLFVNEPTSQASRSLKSEEKPARFRPICG
ncbi:MAG: hypothetical protein A2103_03235 [Gammaproteobacteria bacterium GWF2_41_13]|nr:MAG: hypothetical protein A2103_03235 [Gammaproteobacteria bacterium GWF2_41_13]